MESKIMQPFRKWLKNWYPLIIEGALVVFCAYFIFYSEKFQERISPEKFWSSKVKELECDLKMDKWKVRSLELSIQKQKVIGQYTIQEAIDKAESFGDDVETVAQSATKECEKELKCLEKNLECSKKELELCQNKLNVAKSKLKNSQS